MNYIKQNDIAVIGMAGRFPGAKNIEEFWENIVNGKETISHFSEKELIKEGIDQKEIKNPNYVKSKGIIADIENFDAAFFGLPPSEAELMDPQIRILLECSWAAFENAGCDPESYNGKIGSYFGANDNFYWLKHLNILSNGRIGYDGFTLNLRDYVATRISYGLNLKGPSITSLSACSTSLVTIHQACKALFNNECDMAIAGGVSITYPYKSGYLYQDGLMVSKDGHCRTFDESANGTVFSDGVGVVVLKPLIKAIEENDFIYAIIKGSAINNDGNNKVSYTSPSIKGQKEVILQALKSSEVDPSEIFYIETHGTATKTGDPIEFEALKQAYLNIKGRCFIGSVKPNIGHTNVAAGVASFIKTVLIIKNRTIPPQINFKKLNEKLYGVENPFSITTVPVKIGINHYPLRAGVSAFGFGGTNAHLIIEEAPVPETVQCNRINPFILSARTIPALENRINDLMNYLQKFSGSDLSDIAYTLGTGRKSFAYRCAITAKNKTDIIKKLNSITISEINSNKDHDTIFMFPGQSSQFVNMGRELYLQEPFFKDIVDHCSEILYSLTGIDIKQIIYPEDDKIQQSEQLLRQTSIAQPAIFTISYAIAKLLIKVGIYPTVLIGHSIGEYVAACVSEVLSLSDALYLVANRGKLIQKLPHGSMLAVNISDKEVSDIPIKKISIAAINGPRMCVLSGDTSSVKELEEYLTIRNIGFQSLYTSHAFHSEVMDQIKYEFLKLFDNITLNRPKVKIISTVTGETANDDEITTSIYWYNNLRQTVKFSESLLCLLNNEENIFIESGPGTALTTLARINSGRQKTGIFSTLNNKTDDILYSTINKLWLLGYRIQWVALFENKNCKKIPLPAYTFDHQKFKAKINDFLNPVISSQDKLMLKNKKINDWFYTQSWKRSIIPDYTVKLRNQWLVFAGKDDLSLRVINLLKNSGQKVLTVYNGEEFKVLNESEFQLNISNQNDYDLLFNSLISFKLIPQKILYLWSISAPNKTKKNSVEQANNTDFYSLFFLAQVLGKKNITENISLFVISNNLYKITGSETKVDISKSTVIGPVKVIPQEFPNINCCNIDVDLSVDDIERTERASYQIVSETELNCQEIIVAYRNNYRWVQYYERLSIDESYDEVNCLRPKGVYLITGGLGGMGLAFAEYLAKTVKAKIILTGRSEFPDKGSWDKWLNEHLKDDPVSTKIVKLKLFESYGAEIHIIRGDIKDKECMKESLLKVCSSIGNINGIIHAAGLPGEGIIQLKNKQIVDQILAPKIEGTQVVEELNKIFNPDFIVFCSSIASILGGIGLVDYCSANNYMDLFANSYESNGKCKIISVNWDMWGETGMGLKTAIPRELKEWFDNELKNGITTKEGVKVFQRILSWGRLNNIIVSTRDLNHRVDLWIKREFLKERKSSLENGEKRIKYARPDLSIKFEKPETTNEKKVASIWENLFAIDRIGRRDNFYEIGGHSLLATILANELQMVFGKNISIQDIMDNPTVYELASFLTK